MIHFISNQLIEIIVLTINQTLRIIFPKYYNNNILNKNKTTKHFYKYKKIKKNPLHNKKNINYNNSSTPNIINSNNKILERNEYFNDRNNKDIYNEYQRIKNIINHDKIMINNDKEIKLTNKLMKIKSEIQVPFKEYNNSDEKDKNRYIFNYKNRSQKKNLINILRLGKKSKFQKNIFNHNTSNNNNNDIEQIRNNNVTSLNKDSILKDYILSLKKKKINNKFKTIEDDCKIDFKLFKEYDFNPSKTFFDLKENYNFIEDNNSESFNLTKRNEYILKLRNMLNNNPGIKLRKDFRLSAKRIKKLKIHKYI